MKYSKTGKFTKRQKQLVQEIKQRIEELSESGCCVIGNSNKLKVYTQKDIEHAATDKDFVKDIDYNHEVPYLDAGDITDSSLDEIEYFRTGYITEE